MLRSKELRGTLVCRVSQRQPSSPHSLGCVGRRIRTLATGAHLDQAVDVGVVLRVSFTHEDE